MTKKAFIIVAHGSRLESANKEILALADNLKHKLSGYSETFHAFLEFTKPTLADTLDTLTEKGINHIIVFPYFLIEGSHLYDIKRIVSKYEELHKNISFCVTSHIGSFPGIEDFIANYLTLTS
ncbi:MAG: hypothetical protein A2X47_05475 [Lentisphaerae bacterium GWF2_38_69]|nr:MAG: hypothetical protein A2X47_05475 [Lentisphaerae bacterium GWF2_38_69]